MEMLASEMARFNVRKSVDWSEARCLYRTNITKLFPNQESHPTEKNIYSIFSEYFSDPHIIWYSTVN